MNRPKKLTGVTGKGNCATSVAQVRLIERPLVPQDRFQEIDLRPRQAGEPLRQHLRIGAKETLHVQAAAGEALQKRRQAESTAVRLRSACTTILRSARQVAHDVQVRPQTLAVGLVRGRP